MKLKSFRFAEAIIGLFLTLFVVYSYFLCNAIFKDPAYFRGPGVFSWLENLEFRLYDARSKLRTSIDAGDKEIVIVAIDDDSIAKEGRWPWPRTVMANMVNKLAEAKPKVIGIDILYSEAESAQGVGEIKSLKSAFDDLVSSRKLVAGRRPRFDPQEYSSQFDAALDKLNFDGKLKDSFDSFSKVGSVVLPMNFAGGGLRGAKPDPMPAPIAAEALKVHLVGLDTDAGHSMDGMKAMTPIPELLSSVQGVGYVNVYSDFDGTVRREYPVLKYDEAYYPSFALELVAKFLGYDSKDIVVTPGRSLEIGKNAIPLDSNQSMLISFNGPNNTFHTYSFDDVLNGKVAMDVFKDKIVLIGPSAPGIATLYVAPVTHNLPATELIANVIENILHGRYMIRPDWGPKAEYGAIAAVGVFLMFVLPYLGAFGGALVTLFLLLLLGGFGVSYFIKGLWLKIGYPGFLLASGYVVITTKRFFVTEKGKELVEASAIETNKMLGLSFQGQGQLDLAFEKFRACPMDDTMRDLLYNLGLDFERKRQYSKAASVYEHIAVKNPNYKDITEKIKMLKQAAAGAVFGGIGGKQKEGTVLITSSTSKPTLGRYEVEKELGRGAMGIVYLGNDPKINRKVAIKTMVLEEGTEASAVKETKERFFREAESAGTLNHPNIVRIFDAGEEHDVAYIAMEFLEGHDLVRYTQKAALFPMDVAMEYVAKVADALDYANAQGIVHRDIKPANIMLLKDNTIRVTDFGIARITASSKTATGTVVGTPAYMSPEQVGGKKVDGRSDIFSLGVVLFELLLGEKPFKGGDGGLGSLLFQIANDPEPEPVQINPSLPAPVADVIHKALKKDAATRYQRAGEMASALRLCLRMMKEGKAAEAPAPQTKPPAAAAPAVIPESERTIPAGGMTPNTESTIPEPAAAPATAGVPGLERPVPASAMFSKSAPPPAAEIERTIPAGAQIAPVSAEPPAAEPPKPVPESVQFSIEPESSPAEKTLSPEDIAAAITMPAMPPMEPPTSAGAEYERTMPASGLPPVQSEAVPAPANQFGSTLDLTMPAGGVAPVVSSAPRPVGGYTADVEPAAAPTEAAAPADFDRTMPAGGFPPVQPVAPAAAPAPADFDRTMPAGGFPALNNPEPSGQSTIDITLPATGQPPVSGIELTPPPAVSSAEAQAIEDAFAADQTLKTPKSEP